jgi:hypothetical protein
MLNAEASHGLTVEGSADQADEVTIITLTKKYPWWTPKAPGKGKSEAEVTEDKSAFVSKSIFV